MRLRPFTLTALFLIFALPFILSAQTVDELIQKNIEATGGYEKWKSLKTMKITGTIQMQGMEMPFVRYSKRPNKLRIEATMQGQTIVQAYDGQTAWWIFPFMGSTEPQKMPKEQAEDIIEQAEFDGPLIDYKKKGHKVELVGKEDVEGTDAYKLKITLKSGQVIYTYLDSEYFLEIKQTAKRSRQGNELEVFSIYGDYKEVDGLLLPHSIIIQAGPQTTNLVIEKVEFNIDLDDDFFIMPASEGK
ncbi:MAG: hypothetical protein Q9P14_02825 [candidate division KSB1 bacterium]|nr:hypothetical protein [candidate division KSB1 bacterium]MDQ7064497.1 hypothetical protein [candidate division KSB1 bacterium]